VALALIETGNLWRRGERDAQAADYGHVGCRCHT